MPVLPHGNCVVPENIHTPTAEGHWKFRGGGGVLEGKSFKGMYEPKLEFPEGRGGSNQKKNSLWEEYGYFLEKHIMACTCSYMRCSAHELHIFMWQVIFTLAQLSLNGKRQYS